MVPFLIADRTQTVMSIKMNDHLSRVQPEIYCRFLDVFLTTPLFEEDILNI